LAIYSHLCVSFLNSFYSLLTIKLKKSSNYKSVNQLNGKKRHMSSPPLPRGKSYVDKVPKTLLQLGNIFESFPPLFCWSFGPNSHFTQPSPIQRIRREGSITWTIKYEWDVNILLWLLSSFSLLIHFNIAQITTHP
jgi:hypothetical protein